MLVLKPCGFATAYILDIMSNRKASGGVMTQYWHTYYPLQDFVYCKVRNINLELMIAPI